MTKQIDRKEPPSEKRESAGEEERLRRVIAEYEARLAEIATLAAHVRHEINNPLTGLIGQAQLLLREDLSDTALRRVQTIAQLATRIRDTVAELRDVQRPNTTALASDDEEESVTKQTPPRH